MILASCVFDMCPFCWHMMPRRPVYLLNVLSHSVVQWQCSKHRRPRLVSAAAQHLLKLVQDGDSCCGSRGVVLCNGRERSGDASRTDGGNVSGQLSGQMHVVG